MPSNFTENYNLSQWERTDKVQMEDFNSDNAKIDAAIKAEAEARAAGDAALQATLATKGNVRVALYSYTGTGLGGAEHPCFIPFQGNVPFMVVLLCGENKNVFLFGGTTAQFPRVLCPVSWTNEGVSWYAYNGDASDQLNSKGATYRALMFYKLD